MRGVEEGVRTEGGNGRTNRISTMRREFDGSVEEYRQVIVGVEGIRDGPGSAMTLFGSGDRCRCRSRLHVANGSHQRPPPGNHPPGAPSRPRRLLTLLLRR